MKIILMGHVDGFGGAQTAFKELFNFAINEGYDVKAILLSNNNLNNYELKSDLVIGKVEHFSNTHASKLKKILNLIKVTILAKSYRPDVFVTVGLSNSANFVARFLGVGCFKIGQDFISGRPIEDLLFTSSRSILDGIALQAPSMLKVLQENNNKFSLKGINWLPCFPEAPYEGINHINYTSMDDKIRLSYFGRLASNKGLPILLRALSSPQISPNVTLDIWGQGEQENTLRSLTKELNLEKRIRFQGIYPNHFEAAKLMASYDALVLTSTSNEGLPLILLEAMAYGIPFLVTNVGAIQDCTINNPDAVLVNPNVEDIIKGLEMIIDNLKTGCFDSHRQQQYYNKYFSYSVMSNRWRECFFNPKYFFNAQ